jgi:hypothetical protein
MTAMMIGDNKILTTINFALVKGNSILLKVTINQQIQQDGFFCKVCSTHKGGYRRYYVFAQLPSEKGGD